MTVDIRPDRHRVVCGGRHRPAAVRPGPVAAARGAESIDGVVVEQRASARWPFPSLLPRRPAQA